MYIGLFNGKAYHVIGWSLAHPTTHGMLFTGDREITFEGVTWKTSYKELAESLATVPIQEVNLGKE